jgi:hypothetical protein
MSFPEFIKKSFYILTVIFFICLSTLYIMLTHKNRALKVLSKIHISSLTESLITVFLNRFTVGLVVLKKPSILMNSFIFFRNFMDNRSIICCYCGLCMWDTYFNSWWHICSYNNRHWKHNPYYSRIFWHL